MGKFRAYLGAYAWVFACLRILTSVQGCTSVCKLYLDGFFEALRLASTWNKQVFKVRTIDCHNFMLTMAHFY